MRFEGSYECFDDDGKSLGTIDEADPGEWLYHSPKVETSITPTMLRNIANKVEGL